MSSHEQLLEAKSLCAWYGAAQILYDVDLEVRRGEVVALMGNPYLVLLDEPSEGVAPVIVEQMANMILELKAQGVSILLSEQNMHFAELVSDRAYVLEKGQIRYQASMAELAANDEVRRAYLSV